MQRVVASSLVLLAVSSASGSSVSGFVAPGKCPSLGVPNLRVDQAINFADFSGMWYEYSVTKNPVQPTATCVRHDFESIGKGFKFVNTGVTNEGRSFTTTGEFYVDPNDESRLTVDVDQPFSPPLHILDTDYKNYACLYTCAQVTPNHYVDIAFVFGRYPYLTSDYARKCYAIFDTINVDASRFAKTRQGYPCLYDKQKVY